MKDKKKLNTKLTTPEFRVSYPNVFQARSFKDQKAKYSLVMLFKKKTDISALKKAALACVPKEYGTDRKKWPESFKWPFRDGDRKQAQEGYKDTIFVPASSSHAPAVVGTERDDDGKLVQLDEESGDFYAGCYARAAIGAGYFKGDGFEGVKFYLNNVQKLRDGKRLDSRTDPNEDFDSVEDMDGGDSDNDADDDGDSDENFGE